MLQPVKSKLVVRAMESFLQKCTHKENKLFSMKFQAKFRVNLVVIFNLKKKKSTKEKIVLSSCRMQPEIEANSTNFDEAYPKCRTPTQSHDDSEEEYQSEEKIRFLNLLPEVVKRLKEKKTCFQIFWTSMKSLLMEPYH